MLILLDENVPTQLLGPLRLAGHDVMSVLESHPGIPDSEVLDLALQSGRLLVTFDKELVSAIMARKPEEFRGVILLRLPMGGTEQLVTKIIDLFGNWHNTDNCATIVKRDGVRVRRIATNK